MKGLDATIHPLNRFKICATLSAFQAYEGSVRAEMRFAVLREETGLSEATLSKQLGVLVEAGYVDKFREYGPTRAKDIVWVMLTAKGKSAFDAHVAALRALA